MKAIGIAFLYDRNLGTPEEISKKFSEYFPNVNENIVLEGLMDLVQLKEIMDAKRIFWAGVKENFDDIMENGDLIGDLAWNVFKKHANMEPSEDIKSLIYKGSEAPWKFNLIACILYK